MAKPRRRYVRANARWEFLERMYYATGISTYHSRGYFVERLVKDIPLYGVERLTYILFLYSDGFDYDYYFKSDVLRENMVIVIVYDARRRRVVDWRGIP
ncbi:MAG: hypothetical protein QXP58_07045 [Thermoprotei archaeon]